MYVIVPAKELTKFDKIATTIIVTMMVIIMFSFFVPIKEHERCKNSYKRFPKVPRNGVIFKTSHTQFNF